MIMKESNINLGARVYCGTENNENASNIPQPDSKNSSGKSVFASIRALARSASVKQLNPWFRDPSTCYQYAVYQKDCFYFNIIPQIPNIFVLTAHVATHDNYQLSGADSQASYLFTTSWILTLLAVSVFLIYATAQVALSQKWFSSAGEINRLMHSRCQYIIRDFLWGRIEDFMVISGIISIAMLLIGRVLAGQCPEDTPVHFAWSVQACNPYAEAKGIPTDQVLIIYGYCLACQMIFNGVTVEALIINWIIAVGAVVASVAYVGGIFELYVALYSVLFITFSFEFERRMRLSFLQAQIIRDAEGRKVDLLMAKQRLEHDMNKQEQDMVIERKNHQLELLAIAAENEKKLMQLEKVQLRSLMGNVAHDMKTPLHAISGDLDIMKADLKKIFTNMRVAHDVQESFMKLIDSAEATCRFMAMTINRSQDYMKTSADIPLVPSQGACELIDTIRNAVGYVSRCQTGRSIVVHPMPAQINQRVVTDEHWLTENLMCLVSNAVKYSDRGATVDVRVCLDRNIEAGITQLHFSVEDTGIGISEEARANLFQPFKQAQRRTGGTGLGLFTLFKRIEALGGSCGVESRSDGKQGSLFWFNIPYVVDSSVVSTPCGSVLPTPRDPAPWAAMSVLVTDDTHSVLKVTERLLVRKGHRVETAENGSQALERLRKDLESGTRSFDLVLTDLQMPVMDGLEFVRIFRQLEDALKSRNRQFIIGMSANCDSVSRQEAMDAGMNGFISKPFKYDELQNACSAMYRGDLYY